MSTFAEAFELPYVRVVNGKSYTLPILSTRDYLPWVQELTESRRKDETARIPQLMAAKDKMATLRNISLLDVTPDDLVPLVETPAGTIRVLEMSGRKAGVPEGELVAFVDGCSLRTNTKDAFRVSGLVSAEWFAMRFPQQPAPWLIQLWDAASAGDPVNLAAVAVQCVAEQKAALEAANKPAEPVPNEIAPA